MRSQKNKFTTGLIAGLVIGWSNPAFAEGDARLIVREPFKGAAQHMQYSPDGQFFVTTAEKDIYFWHREGVLLRKLSHSEEIACYVMHPQGDKFAIVDKSGNLIVQKNEGGILWQTKLPNGGARKLAYSSDGALLIAQGATFHSLWKAETGTLIRESTAPYMAAIALSPDNQWLAFGGDGVLALVRVSDGTKVFNVTTTGQIVALVFSPDSQRIYTGHYGKTSSAVFFTKKVKKFAVWDLTGKELNSNNAADEVYSIALSADGKSVITGSYNGYIEHWNLDGDQTRKVQAIPEASDTYSGLMNVIAPDPQTSSLLLSSTNSGIFLMNLDGSRVFSLNSTGSNKGAGLRLDLQNNALSNAEANPAENKMRDRDSLINGITISPVADAIISTGYKDSISLWNKEGTFIKSLKGAGERTRRVMSHENRGLAAHPKAAKFAVVLDDSKLAMMDFEGAVLWTVDTPKSFGNIVFTPDGKYLAVPGVETVQIYTDAGVLVKKLPAEGYAKYLAYSNNGAMLACGGTDEIQVWNAAGKPLATRRDRSGKKLRFSADDRHLISGIESENLVFWETKGFTAVARMGFGDNGSYALAANDGRFEYAGSGDSLLYWLVGQELIGLGQFKEKYYTPGLLQEILAAKANAPKPEIAVSKRLVGRVFQIKANGDVVIFTKVSGTLRAGKKLKILNGANYVDATIANTLHTNVTAKAKGTVAVGNPVFE